MAITDFFIAGTVLVCRLKPIGGSALEQTLDVVVKVLLSLGASRVSWNHFCGELHKMGQSMADKWQFTLQYGVDNRNYWIRNLA